MENLSPSVQVFLELAKAQTILTRRFDAGLGGLGLNEFMILHQLHISTDETLRRIDLADNVGLTQSGITRLLAPMEKIGLVKRKACAEDARVSYVVLAPGGKRKYEEAVERAEMICEELLAAAHVENPEPLRQTIRAIGVARI